MAILIIGAGNIGRAVAYDLSKEFELAAVDVSEENLAKIEKYAKPIKFNVTKEDVVSLMKKYELIVDTLPGKFGFQILKSAIKASVDIVDVSFMPEDPLHLQGNITAVVDAGFAPGLSNILLGHIYSALGELDEGMIRVGGLPKNPEPPLYYNATWSPEDLIEEYTRKARIIKNGGLIEVDPLENIHNVSLEGYEFEEFPSDGLRSLLYTVQARNMEERTLRWPGHLKKMKFLKDLGFFKEENRDTTLKVLLSFMKNSKDFCIMEVYGKKGNKIMRYIMKDEAREFSSMARVTGYTASTISKMVLNGRLERGILPPEYIGMRKELFKYALESLKNKGIKIEGTSNL